MSTVYHSQTGSVLLLPLAGTKEQDLSITIEEGRLRILVKTVQEDRQYLLNERSLQKEYTFGLKPNVNTDLINAKLEHGLLTIHIPSNRARKEIKILAA